jgi:hypothetical protein
MKTLVLATVAIFGLAGVAAAADMYVKAPPPAPAPVVGKAPIGKAPIGKAPLGKGPVVTRG